MGHTVWCSQRGGGGGGGGGGRGGGGGGGNIGNPSVFSVNVGSERRTRSLRTY